jgi:hypothetical protein
MPSIPITATTDLTIAGTGTTRLRYVSSIELAENAGTPAAARVQLREGGSGGAVKRDIRLKAEESKGEGFSPPLFFPEGVYILASAGTVRGSIEGW